MANSQPASEAPRPEGYSTVAPWLISADTAAELTFLASVFGATEKPGSRIITGGRIAHVEVDLAGTAVLLFDSRSAWSVPAHTRVYVHDVGATVGAALALGAQLVTNPTDMAFGDRVARFRDTQGHLWWVHQHVEDVAVDEMMRRFDEPRYIQANEYVARSLEEHMASWVESRNREVDAPDLLISRVIAAVGAGRPDDVKLVLHPYLHWTMTTGETLRGRTKVLAALQDGQRRATEVQEPSSVELRDGQIYRWSRN